MDVRPPNDPAPVLRREVEPPPRQPAGLGVLLCASAALFFAVTGSAFLLRAHFRPHCCDRHHLATRPDEVRAVPVSLEEAPAPSRSLDTPSVHLAAPPASPSCGAPTYHSNADGTVSVAYRLCQDGEPQAP